MNDQELLDLLTDKDSGMTVTFISETLFGISRQNAPIQARKGTFFKLERLIKLYDHLRYKDSSNLRALTAVSQTIDERWPVLRDSDRHLVELSPEPWHRARMLLPDKEWLVPMLSALGHDRRPYAFQREIQIILPHADPASVQRTCMRHFNLRYRLKLLRADVPALIPPTLILDEKKVLTLGERELRPSSIKSRTSRHRPRPCNCMFSPTSDRATRAPISGGTASR